MGNCMFCKKTSGAHDERSDSCKVWLPDGNVMLIFKPTKVKEVMRRYQNYFLVLSVSLQSNGRFVPLEADSILLPNNNVYVMFPMERINTRVTTADIEGQHGGGRDILVGGAGGRGEALPNANNRGGAGGRGANVRGGGNGAHNVGGGVGGRGAFNRGGGNGGHNVGGGAGGRGANVRGGAGGRGANVRGGTGGRNGRGRGRAGYDEGGGLLYNAAAGAVRGAFNAGINAVSWVYNAAGAQRDDNGRRSRPRDSLEPIPGRPGWAYVIPDHLRYVENIPNHYARLAVPVDSNGRRLR